MVDRERETSGTPAWLDRREYPFQSRWLPLPAGSMHYVDEGSGEAILFSHGTPTWSFEWRHLVRDLRARYRCVAPDHLGFGLSERPADFPYTPEAHSANLRAFADALGLDGITLVVHDYGGPIALPLALEDAGRVRRLVLLNTWMWSFEDDLEMRRRVRVAGGKAGLFLYRWANFSLRVLMPYAYGDRRLLTADIHRQYLGPFQDREARGRVLWPLARALLASSAFYDGLWRRRDRLKDLPVLLLWGTKDAAFAPRMLDRWREAVPSARVVELPVGHWPHEEAPERVTEELSRFLEEKTPGDRTDPAS